MGSIGLVRNPLPSLLLSVEYVTILNVILITVRKSSLVFKSETLLSESRDVEKPNIRGNKGGSFFTTIDRLPALLFNTGAPKQQ